MIYIYIYVINQPNLVILELSWGHRKELRSAKAKGRLWGKIERPAHQLHIHTFVGAATMFDYIWEYYMHIPYIYIYICEDLWKQL